MEEGQGWNSRRGSGVIQVKASKQAPKVSQVAPIGQSMGPTAVDEQDQDEEEEEAPEHDSGMESVGDRAHAQPNRLPALASVESEVTMVVTEPFGWAIDQVRTTRAVHKISWSSFKNLPLTSSSAPRTASISLSQDTLVIVELTPDGQAIRRGVRVGQRVVAFGGVKVTSVGIFIEELAKVKEVAADGAGTAEVRVTLVGKARRPSVF